ncbi:hypothetical protein [Anaerococcus tetradius]|uniref:Uncharacterized protein n=1 Tax=Anaerococcus tetradius ATCC 35098 TaxID=525255 RepID=C2CHJ7_9FIRM|nr:hypothetical protein [Anaerococcus tetradius]EEI82952.1 hypothetical protein HMPREF0077_0957 [Anaerococcus tetradius ATCC 35098]
MGENKEIYDSEKIAEILELAIVSLNRLKVEEAKQVLINLQKKLIPENRMDLGDFQDEIFKGIDFSDESYGQDLMIDKVVVGNMQEFSETLRAFRILSKAYNIHCKPKKIIIDWNC